MATEPPAPSPAVLYVDTSALLKLLVREAESAAIERELLMWSELALGKELAGVATYDKRMQDALDPLGVRVIAPEETAQEEPLAETSPSNAGDQDTQG